MKTLISVSAFGSALALALAGHATAGANLIQNGNFSQPTNLVNGSGQSAYFRDTNGAGYITDWTYNVPGGSSANNGGIITVLDAANLNSLNNQTEGPYSFWNSTNGGVGTIATPPSGDRYVLGQDSAPENAAYLSQTINGLTSGRYYAVTFAFAGAQLRNSNGSDWNGATNEGVEVNLGGTYDTSAPGGTASQAYTGGQTDVDYYDNYQPAVPNHGSTGWQDVYMVFKAVGSSEVLNLEAISTSSGDPPFALIDNVQMFAIPEPAAWAMMLVGIGGLGAVARRRRATVLAA
jgi:hypothetical protein